MGDTGDKVPRTYRLEPGPIDLRKRKRGEGKKRGQKTKGQKTKGQKRKGKKRRKKEGEKEGKRKKKEEKKEIIFVLKKFLPIYLLPCPFKS